MFRNAFDNKFHKLIFRGKSVNLEKIYHVWQASGDADTSVGTVRQYNKTHDHFNLNAYLKMLVFLALQIPSQTTIKINSKFCEGLNWRLWCRGTTQKLKTPLTLFNAVAFELNDDGTGCFQ